MSPVMEVNIMNDQDTLKTNKYGNVIFLNIYICWCLFCHFATVARYGQTVYRLYRQCRYMDSEHRAAYLAKGIKQEAYRRDNKLKERKLMEDVSGRKASIRNGWLRLEERQAGHRCTVSKGINKNLLDSLVLLKKVDKCFDYKLNFVFKTEFILFSRWQQNGWKAVVKQKLKSYQRINQVHLLKKVFF